MKSQLIVGYFNCLEDERKLTVQMQVLNRIWESHRRRINNFIRNKLVGCKLETVECPNKKNYWELNVTLTSPDIN